MQEKIFCEATMYYGADSLHRNTYRVLFRLRDAVDGEMLQRAADEAIRRYPYYAMRCCANESEFSLEPHHAPFTVHNTQEPVDLGGEASNGYLMAVSYWDDTVWVNGFHGLADGSGIMEFSRTLLYYYCRERYDADLPAGNIRVNDGPIPTAEWDNPYLDIMSGKRKLPSDDEIIVKVKPDPNQKVLNLCEDPRITPTHSQRPYAFRLRIEEQELMRYCRKQDGTPAVVCSLLLSRAVEKLNPDTDKAIVTGMAVDLRPALEAPLYRGSPLALAYLPYSGKLRQKSFDMQSTIYRGRLILASDKERLQAGINSSTRLYKAIYQIPTLEGKRQLVRSVVERYKGASTFLVSYMGPAHLGAVEPYVTEVFPQNDGVGGGITLELSASGGAFFLEFVQEWPEELYFRAFCEELTAQGIGFTHCGEGENKVPDIHFPC